MISRCYGYIIRGFQRCTRKMFSIPLPKCEPPNCLRLSEMTGRSLLFAKLLATRSVFKWPLTKCSRESLLNEALSGDNATNQPIQMHFLNMNFEGHSDSIILNRGGWWSVHTCKLRMRRSLRLPWWLDSSTIKPVRCWNRISISLWTTCSGIIAYRITQSCSECL